MASSEETGRDQGRQDPLFDYSKELADKYGSGLSDDDTFLFVRFTRGQLDPETLDQTQREYFEVLSAHLYIEGFLDMAAKLHDLASREPSRDNRVRFLAAHARDALAPVISDALEDVQHWSHGFDYEIHHDSIQLSITEGFCLGGLQALVNTRRHNIESLYGGPSNLKLPDQPSTQELVEDSTPPTNA